MTHKPRTTDPRCPISGQLRLEDAIEKSSRQKVDLREGDAFTVVVPAHPLLRGTFPQALVGKRGRVVSAVYSGLAPVHHQNFHQVRLDGEIDDRELPAQAMSRES